MLRTEEHLETTPEARTMNQGFEDLTHRIQREVPHLVPLSGPVLTEGAPGDYGRAAAELHDLEVSLEGLWPRDD